MKKIGVVLGGCGVYDGSEIYEVVIILLVIVCNGVQVVCFVFDKLQCDVINYLIGEVMLEQCNVLVEVVCIVCGDILLLVQVCVEMLDVLIVSGGFGVVKNLSSFVVEGSECQVDFDLWVLVLVMYQVGKLLGFMCIVLVMLLKIFVFLLWMIIGIDFDIVDVVEEMGVEYVFCLVDDIVVDEDNKVVIILVYMLVEDIV